MGSDSPPACRCCVPYTPLAGFCGTLAEVRGSAAGRIRQRPRARLPDRKATRHMQHKPETPSDIAHVALVTFGVIAAGVTVIAVIESYSNLLAFVRAYGMSGWRAAIAPGAVDSFVIMGELLLFAAILLHWGKSAHILGAGMAAWGFILSVGGNVWHAPVASAVDRAVSAVWPVTATVALAGALLIVRQIMAPRADEAAEALIAAAGTEVLPEPARPEELPPGRPAPSRTPRRGRAPAVSVDEEALLAELLEAGTVPASYRAWSFEKTGMYRSAPTKRVYDEARARLDTDQGRLGRDQDVLGRDQAVLGRDQAVLNGAGHAN
jgi:hypothetical protein